MLLSMTGYGYASEAASSSRGKLEISVEVRTVNSKFLDLNIRSPRAYNVFDAEIGKLIRQTLRRGRVDATINVEVLEGRERDIFVNQTQAAALYAALKNLKDSLKISADVTITDLLAQPDWLQIHEVEINESEEWALLSKVLSKALEQVVKTRKAEGESLLASISGHLKSFSKIFTQIEARHDEMIQRFRQKSRDRLQQLFQDQSFDPVRLEQEVVMWVARSDFREEIDRIKHHLQTFEQTMGHGAEVGRKLEFVLQELHREVNTLGTKCPDASALPLTVELKSFIERMREQIQNVE